MTREEKLDWLYRLRGEIYVYMPKEWIIPMTNALDMPIKALEQEPKTGHWIMIDQELQRYKCSECGEVIRLYKKSEIPKLEKDETLSDYSFSHCGCRMIESQESDIEKREPCINYEDGCEEWAGCPCVYYKAESEE